MPPRESYPAPGALPEVRAGTAEEDLRRRDFTVNAIAVGLGGQRKGETAPYRKPSRISPPHACACCTSGAS